MTKRKTVLSLLIVAMVCFMAFFITACNDPSADIGGTGDGTNQGGGTDSGDGTGGTTGDTCNHVWTTWKVDLEATCEVAGSESRSCAACQSVETRVIEALGHSYSAVWQTDSSKHYHICTRCNTSRVDESIHDFDQNECATCGFMKYTTSSALSFTPIQQSSETVGYMVSGVDLPESYTVVSIPATYSPDGSLGGELPVLKIARGAFKNNTTITRVIIPEGVTEILAESFSGCTALTSVEIPSTVTAIEDGAFKNCYKLIEVYNASTRLANMTAGATNCGGAARYAKNVYTPTSGASKLTNTADGYIFFSENATTHYLMGYIGSGVLALPQSFEESGYSIYDYAFYGNTRLTGVTIPSSVTAIGTYAFANCSGMTGTLTIPSGIAIIDNYSFMGCLGLSDISLPSTVTAIGDWAFAGCKRFGSITIPDSVSVIGDNAFASCGGLSGLTLSNTLMTIGEQAFIGCEGLQTLSIPNSVRYLGRSAFKNCRGLRSVNFGTSLLTIGDNAFEGCGGFRDLVIPASVTTIGSGAFKDCTALSSITIDNSKAAILDSAFSGCSVLNSVNLNSGIVSIGDRAFADCGSLTSITIPDSVTTLGNFVFSGCNEMVSVVIGNGVTAIYTNTFAGSNSMYTLTIGNSVSIIQDSAFSGFKNLISLTLGTGLTTIYSSAFSGCTALTSLSIPQSVTTIMDSAFKGCNNINKIEFEGESGLTTIGANAFEGLSKIEKIILPDTLTTIGAEAFKDCTSLTNTDILSTSDMYDNYSNLTTIGSRAFENCTSIIMVGIPRNVTTIGDYAFNGCTSLRYIAGGSGLTSISSNMFSGCTALNNINLSTSLASIASSAFEDLTNLSTVSINALTTLGSRAFAGCTALKSIELPENVETIGSEAFYGCDALEHISLGASLKFIGTDAFKGCNNLNDVGYGGGSTGDWESIPGTDNDILNSSVIFIVSDDTLVGIIDKVGNANIVIPESPRISAIGEKAFDNNKNLVSIYIPSRIVSIRENAFAECDNLERVHYQATKAQYDTMFIGTGNQLFENAKRGYASYFTYEAIDNNTAYAVTGLSMRHEDNISEIPDTFFDLPVTEIKDGAFKNLYFGEIIIGKNIKTIGANAFANAMLDELIIPDNVTSIGDGAFANCRGLSSITIGAGLEAIPSNAFVDARIQEIIIPETVKSIGEAAFIDCPNLSSVRFAANSKVESIGARAFKGIVASSLTIPDSVKTIGEEAFANCTKLVTVNFGKGLTRLADRLFSKCGLENVVLPYGLQVIDEGAFQNCSLLRSIRIPTSITSVEPYAFKSCNRLSTVYYDGMQTGWDGITIAENNTILTMNAKLAVANYLRYTLNEDEDGYTVRGMLDGYSEESIVIPDTYLGIAVDAIAANAFNGETTLTSITIPTSITTIMGASAFNVATIYYEGTEEQLDVIKGENTLENITIHYGNNLVYSLNDGSTYTVTGVAAGADAEQEQIIIPTTYHGVQVTAIAASAFGDITTITSVVIPTSVVTIGDTAFNEAVTAVYYGGDSSAWALISGNTQVEASELYLYSQATPTTEGNFWHYVDGVVTVYDPYEAA